MKTASSFNTSIDTKAALRAAYTDLEHKLGGPPSWMAVHGTYQHSGEDIVAILETLAPGVPFQGGTSCLGIMTEAGFHSDQGVSLGLFGIHDPEGVYSVGYAEGQEYSRRMGQTAIAQALDIPSRFTAPALIWITCAPGDEEGIIAGIEQGLSGAKIPIIGGSSADNTLEGNWYQIANGQVLYNGVVVTAMYPSRTARYAFDNSFQPTIRSGVITKISGRIIYEIDHRPAAEVYNEWTGGLINDYLDGGNILSLSTLQPLGRRAVMTRSADFYQLSHPEAVVEDRALALFTTAEHGERIFLMESTPQDLVYSPGKVISKVYSSKAAQPAAIAGALVIFCAGCMLAVQDEMPVVAAQFREALFGQPFLGLYTFGEQGCPLLGENRHANLMTSLIVFEK